MKHLLSLLLIVALWLGLAAATVAQAPGQLAANPGQTPATPQGQPGGEATQQRGGTIEYVVACAGAALVLLVVCYPSRRQ